MIFTKEMGLKDFDMQTNRALLGVLGADMETAALFTVGRIRRIRTASILNNVVVYGNDTSESIGSYADGALLTAEGEHREILTALEAIKAVTA